MVEQATMGMRAQTELIKKRPNLVNLSYDKSFKGQILAFQTKKPNSTFKLEILIISNLKAKCNLGSISSMFYKQLLRAQITKVQKSS